VENGVSARPLRGKVLSALIDGLAYNAKLNKPSNDWKTSEWDRVVEQVAAAMKAKRDEPPRRDRDNG
jgi:hypothetical protein